MKKRRPPRRAPSSPPAAPAAAGRALDVLADVVLGTVAAAMAGPDPVPARRAELRAALGRLGLAAAGQDRRRLARLLAVPAVAALELADDLALVARAAADPPGGSAPSPLGRQAAALAEAADLALALILRRLRPLEALRARGTACFDLAWEAFLRANGSAADAVALIRRPRQGPPAGGSPPPDDDPDDDPVTAFAWETYLRVRVLDRMADVMPRRLAPAARRMQGWPVLQMRRGSRRGRLRHLDDALELGADHPLEASAAARYRLDTPMVGCLTDLIGHLHDLREATAGLSSGSVGQVDRDLRIHWWSAGHESADPRVLKLLRAARRLPPLTRRTAPAWAKRVLVPLLLATDARDHRNCGHPALRAVASQRGVKSRATFESRLLAKILQVLTGMARPA